MIFKNQHNLKSKTLIICIVKWGYMDALRFNSDFWSEKHIDDFMTF